MTGPDNMLKNIKATYVIFLIVMIVGVFLHAPSTHAASVYVEVAQQEVHEGDTVLVDWYVDTQGDTYNVVSAGVNYSPDTLTAGELSTGASAISLWVKKPAVITPGNISFVGGIPGGIDGQHILLMRTVFKAQHVGTSTLSLDTHSQILHADGLGTETTLSMHPVTFSILPPENNPPLIVSSTHPHQNAWSRHNDVTFTINVPIPDGYRYSFSTDPQSTPTEPLKAVSKEEIMTYKTLPDGIYYFKLGVQSGGSLQEVGTYRVMIDTTAPTILSARVEQNQELFSNKPFLNFYATDTTSGINTYEVKVGWLGTYHRAISPYHFARPWFGNVITLKATDVAGNTQIQKMYYRGHLSNIVSAMLLVCIGGTLLYSIYRYIWQKIKNY